MEDQILRKSKKIYHLAKILKRELFNKILAQWKRIDRKQSARWQHLSWLKAGAFFYFQKII
jgi:hypothetical protein